LSGCGIVSRVTPVHTALRNCTRDEGRPFEVGNQVLISSHRKLLSSSARVLRDRCQRELELSAARPTQSQTPKPQNALEMSKQHLSAFSVTPRSFECLSLGQLASNVASLLVDAARHPAERRLRATLRLEQTAATVAHAGHVKSVSPSLTNVPVVRRVLPAGQMYTSRSLSNLKSSRLKAPSSRFDLSIPGMCGAIFFSLTSQSRFAPEP